MYLSGAWQAPAPIFRGMYAPIALPQTAQCDGSLPQRVHQRVSTLTPVFPGKLRRQNAENSAGYRDGEAC